MLLTHFSSTASVANSAQSPVEFLAYICLTQSSGETPIFLQTGFMRRLDHSSASSTCSLIWVMLPLAPVLIWWCRITALG